jgi:O-antigen ligase
VLPEGKLLIQAAAFVAAGVAALLGTPATTASPRLPLILLLGVGALGAIQLIPTSVSILDRISPTSAEIYRVASRTLEQFDRASLTPRISIAPTDTAVTTLLVLAYVALFFAASRTFATRPRRRLLLGAIITSAIGQTIYAGLTIRTDRASGSFVNPNHLAGYLEIGLASAFGLILWASLVGRDRAHFTKDPFDRIYKRWTPVAWASIVWAVIAIGIAITRSRGGILMATVATLAMLTMAVLRGRSRYRRAIAAGEGLAVLAGLSIVAMTTGTYPLLRFLTSDPRDAESDMRVQLWRLSIDAWKNFPLLGSGLGSYREAFRRIQPEGMNALVEQAHNDGLQMLVTGGLVGYLLASAALVWLLVLFARAFVRQKHREERAWAVAGFGALLSLLLHGLVEFNFSIPAIPATLSVMLGGAWAAATRDE